MPGSARNPRTRERLLETGLELVLRSGYHGTGIAEIVRAAGVPKGSFYNYFDSKEAFVAELIERYGEALRETLRALLRAADCDDALEALTNAYREFARLQQATGLPGCLIGNLGAEIDSPERPCSRAVRTQMDAWAKEVAQLLARGQAQGSVRADHEASDLARFFWDAWEGALLRAKLDASPAALEFTLRMLGDFLRPADRAAAPRAGAGR